MFKVVEHFVSINGEGRYAGKLALFIRFKGCNLNCGYCDTKWANEKEAAYQVYTLEALEQLVINSGVSHVTLTGGEPLIQEGMVVLLKRLSEVKDLSVEVETNGSVDLTLFKQIVGENIHFTVDYKTLSSLENGRMHRANYDILNERDIVKAVVGTEEDLLDVLQLYKTHGLSNLYMSPVFGQIDLADIVSFMKRHQMKEAKLQVQLHKLIWHPEERGV